MSKRARVIEEPRSRDGDRASAAKLFAAGRIARTLSGDDAIVDDSDTLAESVGLPGDGDDGTPAMPRDRDRELLV